MAKLKLACRAKLFSIKTIKNNMNAIEINHLIKRYDNVVALSDISLQVKKDELFGLIGPDGAGKTTLFRILTTLLLPDSGIVSMEGINVLRNYHKIRNIIGYMPGRFSLYQDLSVEENLSFFATVFGTTIEENYDLIKDIYIQIEPFKKRKAGKLSGGMKQKLALSCALIHKPKVLVLDEPTTGVDAVSRKEFWEMLQKLKTKGITIIVSTPYMDEASLCDRVALIQNGKILKTDTPENIKSSYGNPLFAVQTNNMYQLIKDLNNFELTKCAHLFGQFVHFTPRNEFFSEKKLKHYLETNEHRNIYIEPIKPDIEDCFMQLMITNQS